MFGIRVILLCSLEAAMWKRRKQLVVRRVNSRDKMTTDDAEDAADVREQSAWPRETLLTQHSEAVSVHCGPMHLRRPRLCLSVRGRS